MERCSLSKYRPYIVKLLRVTFVFCLIQTVGCLGASDPALNAVRQALQNEDTDPDATSSTLEANLNKVTDKQIVEVLVSYLQEERQKQLVHSGNVGQVVLYLERISGIKGSMQGTFAGLVYVDKRNWDKDVSQWRAWWDANKDYIYWDKQAQSLKVKPH